MRQQVSYRTVTLGAGRHESSEDGACVIELASRLAGEPFNRSPALSVAHDRRALARSTTTCSTTRVVRTSTPGQWPWVNVEEFGRDHHHRVVDPHVDRTEGVLGH